MKMNLFVIEQNVNIIEQNENGYKMKNRPNIYKYVTGTFSDRF